MTAITVWLTMFKSAYMYALLCFCIFCIQACLGKFPKVAKNAYLMHFVFIVIRLPVSYFHWYYHNLNVSELLLLYGQICWRFFFSSVHDNRLTCLMVSSLCISNISEMGLYIEKKTRIYISCQLKTITQNSSSTFQA